MTLQELEKKRLRLHDYCIMKLEEHDYHGVADVAMDLRELQVKIDFANKNPFGKTCNFGKWLEAIK